MVRARPRGPDPDLELLEVAEALWLHGWVRALRYVVLLRVLRRWTREGGGWRSLRTPSRTSTPRARLSFRRLHSRPLLGAVALRLLTVAVGTSLLLDVVVFGTTGAARNYERVFGRFLRRSRWAVLRPRVDACRVRGPELTRSAPRDPTASRSGCPS